MLNSLKFAQSVISLTLMLVHQCSGSANYLTLPNIYNSPTNGLTFAAPLPCDSPTPLPSYDTAFYDHPPLQFGPSHPLSYSSAPHFKYAVAALPPTFVKYASEPRIKVTHGTPVTTTYTTASGFAAPPFAPVPATFATPSLSYAPGVAYAAPSNFFSYASPNFFSQLPPVKRFRAPLPVDTYSYAQGVPNGLW